MECFPHNIRTIQASGIKSLVLQETAMSPYYVHTLSSIIWLEFVKSKVDGLWKL